MIWGWASPPMAPTRCVRFTTGGRGEHGGERVGRASPRSELGGMAARSREKPTPRSCEEDARRRLDEVRAEVERVGLRERDPEPVGVHGAQVCRVPFPDPGHRRGHGALPGRDVRRRHPLGAHPCHGRGQAVGVEECRAVGAVEEHLGPVVADGAPRLDEEVAQRASSGSVPSPAASATAAPASVRYPCEGGRHGPQVVAPDPGSAAARTTAPALVARSSGA